MRSIKALNAIGFLVWLAACAAAATVAFLGCTREHRRTADAKDKLEAARVQLGTVSAQLQDMKALRARLRREAGPQQDADSGSGQLGALLRSIDELVAARGVTLIALRPQPEGRQGDMRRIPVVMAFKGSFTNLYALLHDFDTITCAVAIEKVTVSADEMDPDTCRADIAAAVFER